MFSFFQQVRHFIRSNSRHGTHSPFVYALADQALYRSCAAMSREVHGLNIVPEHYRRVLMRVLQHCNKDRVYDLERKDFLGNALFVKAEELSENIICRHLNEQSILVVDGIYSSKRAHYAWGRAVQENYVTVSIDLFHFGLLIARSGQVKEDFKLRYPFWVR